MHKGIIYTRGALLVEILVAMAVFTVLAGIAAQSVVVGMRANTIAASKEVGLRLQSETMEAVRGVSEESWQNIYGLSKSGTHYAPSLSAGRWVLSPGDGSVVLNGTNYTRYVTIANVSRDPSTRAIENTYNAAHDDPSTQYVTATVSWPGGTTLTTSQYLFRFRNLVCPQTSWSGAGSSGAKQCTDTTYVSATNITSGASLELCSGGC